MNEPAHEPSVESVDESQATATADEELLAALADNFAARLRRGEHPTVEEYAEEHPALTQRIRKVLSAVQMMEQARAWDSTIGAEAPGATIGRYKLLERIGEGGFGVVYMADQQQPVRRKVALKVIKPGMDSRQVIARFDAERQALALMDHPNIAKIFDGGMTDSGRPYFVMELVRGQPITEFSDQHRLAPRERLELFVHVCHAVQHAHQKGIIHRDIKPSNVMVMMHDTTPVVKVIDFGVAKALGHELTDKTLFTGFAQFLGTPLYMSPEQAGQSSLDIDTRSDIYSLGVLLYDLLTGTTPIDKERFRQAAEDEIRRIIREEEPPKPSTRLSDSKDSLPSISALRHTEPAKLTKLVRGELDWIVMKALEKDRDRRYETATGFAADVRRYLSDEPVQACPPSTTYRLRKFARRNRPALLATSAVFTVLLLFVAGLTVSNVRVTRERNEKAAALKEKEQALAVAKGGIFLFERKFDEAAAAFRTAIELNPANDATAHEGLAKVLEFQGKVDEAADAARNAVAIDPKAGRAWVILGKHLRSQNKLDEAAAAYRNAIESNLTNDAIVHWDLGGILMKQGKLEETVGAFRKVVEIDPRADGAWVNLGNALAGLKEFDQAADAYRKAIELDPKDGSRYGNIGRPSSFSAQVAGYSKLGRLLQQQGRPDEAVGVWRELVRRDPRLFKAHFGLGSALLDQNKPEEALAALNQALTTAPQSAQGRSEVARLLGRHAEASSARDPMRAAALAQAAIDLAPKSSSYWNTLGVARYRAGDFEGAIAALQKYRELRTHDVEWSNPFFLAMAHWRLDHKDEARRWYGIGVDCMNKNPSHSSDEMKRFRSEAAELLGVSDAKQPDLSTSPSTADSETAEK